MVSRAIKFAATLGMVSGMALSIATAMPAHAQEARRDFNIPAQLLSSALVEFSRQSDQVVTAPARLTRGQSAPGVQGSYAPRQALHMLVRDTGLTVRTNANGSFMLEEGQSRGNVAPASVNAGVDDNAASDDSNSGEIVVTASKRGEKLRDVPAAITVLGGNTLENLGVQSIRDYATLTPGLTVQDTGAPGYGKVFIRGLSGDPRGQSSTTVYYLDDVPFTSSASLGGGAYIAPATELADVDRIEVLKGPQGTLYGASSLGGVIRLISKRPDPSGFAGSARAELTAIDGGGTGYLLSSTLNIPLVSDRLAVRATGFYRRMPGYVDNIGTGTNNVNESISKGIRIAIGWTPTDRLTIDVVGMMQNINTRGLAMEHEVPGTFTPRYGARKYSDLFNTPINARYRLASITGKYNVGVGQVIATAAYLESWLRIDGDQSATYVPLFPLFAAAGYVYPAGTGVTYTTIIPQEKKTAELRFVSNRLGPVEFIVGGFYTRESAMIPTDFIARNIATGVPLPGPLTYILRSPVDDDYEEISAFGNLTFYLTDKLDVTGGMRYAHYKERFANTPSGVYYNAFFGGPPAGASANGGDNHLAYLATLRWRPTDTLSAFLRAANSFRPGGAQTATILPPGAQAQINPDTVWNYEAGFKADLLERKLSIQASVYHIDWKDIQLYTLFQNQRLLANAGKAKVQGFEVQVDARPTQLLSIGANVGYTHARITEVDPGVTAVIGARAGDIIPQTSPWTGSVTADQAIPLGENLQGQLGATVRLQSYKTTSYPGSNTIPYVRLPGIATVDLRAGIRYERYNLQFRAENILNEKGFTSYSFDGANVPSRAYLIRPRSFTVSLGTNF